MNGSITLEEAQAKLAKLVDQLAPGEEIVITREKQPVAKLVRDWPELMQPRQPGSCKDMIVSMADDFDAPLEDFKEYME